MTALHRCLRLSIVLIHVLPLSCAFVSLLLDLRNGGIQRYRSFSALPPPQPSLLLAASSNERIPRPGDHPPAQGGDMAYIKQNIDRQFEYYTQISSVGGVDCISDVYAKAPTQPNLFWFVGKVASCTGTVSLEEAVNRQRNMLEEHVVRLRPVELGRSFGSTEFWTAPGDSELACANNEIDLHPVPKMDASGVSAREVGCNLEVVTNKGMGFFVERGSDGTVLC